MKTYTNRIKLVLVCLLFASVSKFTAQCLPTFTVSYGPNGSVFFNSAGSPSVGPGTTYFWDFGNGTTTVVVGSAGATQSKTYTLNGVYTVSLVTNNISPTCNSAPFSATIAVTNVPNTCTLLVTGTPATSSTLCNGSAAIVNASLMCAGASYTWSNGSIGSPTVGGLCAGTIYSVSVMAPFGFTCCSIATGTYMATACSIQPSFTSSVISSGTVSNGTTVNFTSTSAGTVVGTSYVWSFGNGATQTTSTPTTSYTYSIINTYNVKLKIVNPGVCKDSIQTLS